jgi:hypothetical protein
MVKLKMKFRKSRGYAAAVTAIVAVAWLFASNHCAFAAAEPASEHVCCHSEKGTPKVPGYSTQCCKALAAPVPHAIAAPEVHLKELQPAWFRVARVEASAEKPILALDLVYDTGPPQDVLSFALLILNCSLLAHAPPNLVA